jgi:hypothetical protein
MLTRHLWAFVGRPGLDPGTLGLKEGYEPSEPTISVGIVLIKGKTRLLVSVRSSAFGSVRGMKRGIFEVPFRTNSVVSVSSTSVQIETEPIALLGEQLIERRRTSPIRAPRGAIRNSIALVFS